MSGRNAAFSMIVLFEFGPCTTEGIKKPVPNATFPQTQIFRKTWDILCNQGKLGVFGYVQDTCRTQESKFMLPEGVLLIVQV
jgi:hypothetical protein